MSRLLKQLERLKQSWFECQQHVRHKTVLSTVELIESWTEVSICDRCTAFCCFCFVRVLCIDWCLLILLLHLQLHYIPIISHLPVHLLIITTFFAPGLNPSLLLQIFSHNGLLIPNLLDCLHELLRLVAPKLLKVKSFLSPELRAD